MIITVTANPSLDRTVEVAELRRGGVLRADQATDEPGGKGVNVSRALATHGCKTVAVVCVGGAEGRRLADLLDDAGVSVRPVWVDGHTRANLTLAEPDGVVTKVNFPGPHVPGHGAEALVTAVGEAAEPGARWIAGCGALPPGLDTDAYAHLVDRAHAAGTRAAVDSSGPALARSLGAAPDLVKPNREELAECAGLPVTTLGEAVDAAGALRERGARAVLASLGADGAVLVAPEGTWYGHAEVSAARSSVGAGDALLAGFLAHDGGGREALAAGLAWSGAAVSLPGSTMPGPDDLARIAVTVTDDIEYDLVLTELPHE